MTVSKCRCCTAKDASGHHQGLVFGIGNSRGEWEAFGGALGKVDTVSGAVTVEETRYRHNAQIAHVAVILIVVLEVPVAENLNQLFADNLILRVEGVTDVCGNSVEGMQLTAGQRNVRVIGNVHDLLRCGIGHNKESVAVEVGIDKAHRRLVLAYGRQRKLIVALKNLLHFCNSLIKTVHIHPPFGINALKRFLNIKITPNRLYCNNFLRLSVILPPVKRLSVTLAEVLTAHHRAR